jgi:two-component system chemotaxis response regulator CheB
MGSSSTGKIKVLIVDDSAFMRKALSVMLEEDPNISIVATARDGVEGVEKVKQFKPDLVTMDIEMPRMDGLTALRDIMQENPTPVMMVSSLTSEGAQATLDALEMGAVDFIPKQLSYVSLDIVKIKEELIAKIKHIAARKHILMAQFRTRLKPGTGKVPAVGSATGAPVSVPTRIPDRGSRRHTEELRIIAIGSSTGGPPALQAVIPKLPRDLPVGIVIAQHMPPTFTKSMADRLDGMSELTVREAADGEYVEPGHVLISPGGMHMTLRRVGSKARVIVSKEPEDTLYHPCVDLLLDSVAKTYGGTSVGIMLSGMGSNGVDGMRELKRQGGVVIAQNEATCVVYGMPRAVVEAKIADHVAPIDGVAHEILAYF